MKIDKYGIYKKMREATPKSGLPRKPEKLLGKKVFFTIESRNKINGVIVESLALSENRIIIKVNDTWFNFLWWHKETGWMVNLRDDEMLSQAKEIKEIKFV